MVSTLIQCPLPQRIAILNVEGTTDKHRGFSNPSVDTGKFPESHLPNVRLLNLVKVKTNPTDKTNSVLTGRNKPLEGIPNRQG